MGVKKVAQFSPRYLPGGKIASLLNQPINMEKDCFGFSQELQETDDNAEKMKALDLI